MGFFVISSTIVQMDDNWHILYVITQMEEFIDWIQKIYRYQAI